MTTKVIINVPHTQHDRAVEVVTENFVVNSDEWKVVIKRTLKEGDTFEEYVYDGRRVVITEVPV